MAHLRFLNHREARRRRVGLLHFLEALQLYLEVGLDLGYGWPEALAALRGELPAGLAGELARREGEGMVALLDRLAGGFPVEEHRLWFAVLRELYGQGAGMREAVGGAAAALRREHERDLEDHCRSLPGRLNVLLIVFFLPPTLALLFVPLLQELLGAFRQ